MNNNIDNWLNGLNEFQEGLTLISFGVIILIISKFIHKDLNNEGYKPFKPFRRKNKSQSEDNFFIIMYMRSFWGIYIGLFIILFGIYKSLRYFF
ncbi:hypothetical protein I6H88_12215 [Elizabethkingia bruuniana]|uniref:Uncharacterized protein n=1 Tax=Elizabethkingia bruuniana TaxID=1756149 RepID=A0A7T7ZWM0_9FLAO|nr:hypothetical protein [Elizabethkingia bruuniana]KGO10413.1 hypothetical protein KS04_09250 [Elizabethkingia miricola]AQX83809.1 hypothetical protein AYC65_01685 [Elizabethkingia bruuniana]KUY22079.1 hypothetical protein ATB97_12510 [Elizabethkingia bruuniana]OPB62291.1 hypothetical protein BAY12_10250 [Elizabethkingia bruuniana]QQN57219.1 hypothetical protein I6H88_12215 [Elizabethkingia bruuniana]